LYIAHLFALRTDPAAPERDPNERGFCTTIEIEDRGAKDSSARLRQGVVVMTDFVYEPPGGRVIFGAGSRHRLPVEVSRLAAKRVLLIATRAMKGDADVLAEQLGQGVSARIDGVTPHVPAEIATDATVTATNANVDLAVCIGGGSAVGLAKVVARDTGVPIVAVPTTYAGSEMTPIWGLTEGGRKTTGRDARVQPRVVVYDPELTCGLPARTSAASGMNALAHCVEGLYAVAASPVTALLAAEGIRVLARSLPLVVERTDDLPQRSAALYGAWLAGWTLGTAQMGVHHTICHVLGGSFGLPHAGTHSAVLPHATAFNAPAAPAAMDTLARSLATDEPAGALWDLAHGIGAPTALADLGFRRADIAKAADLVVAAAPPNPRPITTQEVHLLLLAAHDGTRPTKTEEESQP
jgi:maleylacetate reductase